MSGDSRWNHTLHGVSIGSDDFERGAIHPLKDAFRRRLRLNFAVCLGVMSVSLTAGAGTIREVVNSNQELCHQFVNILKTVDMPNMTDAQLCKFRFDELPASLTKGFTFPHWVKLEVTDPLEMYKQMVLANLPSNIELGTTPQAFFAGFEGMYKTYELLREAALDQAVQFYTATVPSRPWSGLGSSQSDTIKQLPSEFHLVKMDVDFCHNKDFRFLDQGYAASYQPHLSDPIDANALGGGIIALWHGSLVTIDTGPTLWSKLPGPGPLSVDAIIRIITWQPSAEYSNLWKRPIRAGFSNGPNVCGYAIEK